MTPQMGVMEEVIGTSTPIKKPPRMALNVGYTL